ncbi:MAG: 3-dehydroquinate synthase [Candidatus Latescibacterota bacterium]|jgi:3-dehydroquinate synthase
METVRVELGERSYDILIGHGCLESLGALYTERGLGKSAAIVTNPTVAALYLDGVKRSLEAAGVSVTVVSVPDGESYKTIETAGQIYGDLIAAGIDRKACIVTLGGGVVGDMAGFVAATYLRGIDFVQVPTTLEAQVDASVGGKTAVDHVLGKNMIGAFHQPRLVLMDTATLKTLPEREVRAGLAEVVKHGLIRDLDLVAFLEEHIDEAATLTLEVDQLNWLIGQQCRIKAGVVSADETEKGVREILNYGHTVGHALEVVTDYTCYKHGEAVVLGMLAAGKIAVDKGMWSEAEFARQNALLKRLEISGGAQDLAVEDILDRMSSDKKVRDGVIRFVLPESIGQVVSRDDVTRDEMIKGIQYMQQCSAEKTVISS